MSAPRYAVETVRGNLAVLTTNTTFGNIFAARAEAANLEVTLYSPGQLNDFYQKHLILPTHDTWLIYLTPDLGTSILGEGRGVWSALTSYPHPHLYLLQKLWEQLPIEMPGGATKLLVGEFLGAGGGGSPTLDRLEQALAKHALTLGDGGLSSLHLMSEQYLLDCLIKVIDSSSKAPSITISSDQGVSLLTLVQHLQSKHSKAFKLDFDQNGIVSSVQASAHHTTHELFDKIPGEDSLSLALNSLSNNINSSAVATEEPVIVDPPIVKTTRLPKLEISAAKEEKDLRTRPKNLSQLEFVPLAKPRIKRLTSISTLFKKKGVKIAGRGIALGIIVYLGTIALAAGITLVTINNLKSLLISKNLEGLRPQPIALLMGQYLYGNAVAFNQKELTSLLDIYKQALILSSTAKNLSDNTKTLSTYILAGGGDNLASTLTNTRLEIENLYGQLSLLDGSLTPETPQIISKYDETYQSLKKALPGLKKHTLLAKGVASILPDIIGVGGRTKYLVLFQNNMELRPTGGFIGSYGLISFENGRLYDFQVFDVYEADGQLKGHVEPPEPIKKILGEAKWYLRDSNFDPDFPTSARRAEWFLKKSMNQDVAGTIGVNLETLKGMLQAVGPLDLPDYNEAVSASNLAERAQFHAEVNFFPGSTAKKEYLSSVSDALFQKLKSADANTLVSLASTLVGTLESNDTQLSSTSEGSERVLQTLGWNGGIENKPCPASPCYDDYFYQVDSNFGVNKANFYITKDTLINVAVNKEGIPENTITTTWKNSSTSNAWPAGSYKNYTRTYLPSGANILSLKIGDNLISSSEYTVTSEHGRTVVAYLLTVPINNTTTASLSYTLSTPLKSGTLYSLYVQRQSGTQPTDSIKTTIDTPLYLKPSRLSPEPLELSPQRVIFDFDNDADHRIAVQF